jgi:hypothetical protein
MDSGAVDAAQMDSGAEDSEAAVAAVPGWTRVKIAISSPTTVATAGARAKAGREDADEIEARMNRLLGGKDKTAEVTTTPKLRGGRIATVMRFHLVPFRGDVPSEVGRVKKLAAHYGGREVGAAPEGGRGQVRAIGIGGKEPVELRFTLPLAAAGEFIKASRLGFTPPDADAEAARKQDIPLRQRQAPGAAAAGPQRWVTVIVTVGPTEADEGRR